MARRDELLRRALAHRLAQESLMAGAEGYGLGGDEGGDVRNPLLQSLLGSLMGVYQANQERASQERGRGQQMDIVRMQMEAAKADRTQAAGFKERELAMEQQRLDAEIPLRQQAAQVQQADATMQRAADQSTLRQNYEARLANLLTQLADEKADFKAVPSWLEEAGAIADEAGKFEVGLEPRLTPIIEAAIRRTSGTPLGTQWDKSPHKGVLERINALKTRLKHAPLEYMGATGSDFGWNSYPYLAAPGTPEYEYAQRFRRP